MNLELQETLFSENKPEEDPGNPWWRWNMARTVAAMFNSGGGEIRIGLDNEGEPTGGILHPEHYSADGSPLTKALGKHLDFVPGFQPTRREHPTGSLYVHIDVEKGVMFPCVLKTELRHPDPKEKRVYPPGTVFIRRTNGDKQSSMPPVTRGDWQRVLQLWEANRGVTIQGPIVTQFCLVINKWNPFDKKNTEESHWEARCIADIAETIGKDALHRGLKSIADSMTIESHPGSRFVDELNRAGAARKAKYLRQVVELCREVGLSPKPAEPTQT